MSGRPIVTDAMRDAARAREAGKTLGRPHGARTRVELRQLHPKAGLIRELFKSGSSLCEVAKVCRCHRNTVARFVGEYMPDVQELHRARAASRFERDSRGRIMRREAAK